MAVTFGGQFHCHNCDSFESHSVTVQWPVLAKRTMHSMHTIVYILCTKLLYIELLIVYNCINI